MNANRSPQSLHADCVPISVVLPRNVCSFVNPRRSIWQQRESIGIDTILHSGHDTSLICSMTANSEIILFASVHALGLPKCKGISSRNMLTPKPQTMVPNTLRSHNLVRARASQSDAALIASNMGSVPIPNANITAAP